MGVTVLLLRARVGGSDVDPAFVASTLVHLYVSVRLSMPEVGCAYPSE